ncbi:hypothetical protein [Sphingobium naphthae]|uniref:Uncharacterized protein n=2 Tax=Sphingobium TaxID=165695 RepID=A0A9X7YEU3_SPHYA|nr:MULTISPECIES: hypothetical protein [Sphingobium]MDV5825825.1 hypothetical protein [Sphingobium naphthae]QNG47965.1 hypothetical protein H3V42_10480 [Sphingobium yanoikuyae]
MAKPSEKLDKEAGSSGPILTPLFIHSGFRASSTWFWSKVRADPNCMAFYEPFNEQLAHLSHRTLFEARADNWRSHHPDGKPYMLEYAGTLTESEGVPHFPIERWPGEKFIGQEGINGPLDEDVEVYTQTLIGQAHCGGLIPVLSCCRTLGRVAGLRTRFGGIHILLIRNLFHQWNSFAGQANFDNFYFLDMLLRSMELRDRDDFIGFATRVCDYQDTQSLGDWVSPLRFDMLFCYSVGFHLYFHLLARRHVDIVVDVNRLARAGREEQLGLADRIFALTALRVDLTDARESVDYPLHALTSEADCRIVINMFVEKIIGLTRANEDEVAFLQQQLDSMWEEHGRFEVYTAGAAELIERGKRDREKAAEADATKIALASVTQDAVALRERIALLRRKIEARDKAMEKLVRRAERQAASLELAEARLANAELRLALE